MIHINMVLMYTHRDIALTGMPAILYSEAYHVLHWKRVIMHCLLIKENHHR